MSTERTITATRPGHLDLRLPIGAARVKVDPNATAATVHLHTEDDHGPSADAVRSARSWEDQVLYVAVPEIEGSVTVVGGGGTSVYQSFGTVPRGTRVASMTISGNRNCRIIQSAGDVTFVGGRMVGGGPVVSAITATVTLPPGAALAFRSTSADLTATGHVAAIAVDTTSGDVLVDSVDSLVVSSTSGDVEARRVGQYLNVKSVSGDVEIDAYEGSVASATTVSGDVRFTGFPRAAGQLTASTVSGDLDLRGTGHLNVRATTVSGRNRRR